MLRRSLMPLLLVLAASVTAPLAAQGLRDDLNQLFIFGPGQDPLFLAGSADPNNPITIQAHAKHFIPSASTGNGVVISFITSAIGGNVSNIPLSATAGGVTFSFVGGAPVATSTSPGPVFGERAQTLGKGRIFVAANVNAFHLRALRGVPLNDIELNFTHQNADFPGCDSVFGGDCSLMGIPNLENDVINFHLNLDVNVRVTNILVTYGLLNHVDLGVALPIVSTNLRGTSTAQVVPFGGPTAAHFFSGTPSDPVLSATRNVSGSATGIGDVAARLKVNLSNTARGGFALVADARFPTGDDANLLGSGRFSVRGLGVISARFKTFEPFANFGYLFQSGDSVNDAILATVGFDQLLAPWVSIAADVASQFQVGANKLQLPGVVTYDAPFKRTVTPTDIPDIHDDIIDGSFGFKFTTGPGLVLLVNATWPLNVGGLRPNMLWTAGVEYSF